MSKLLTVTGTFSGPLPDVLKNRDDARMKNILWLLLLISVEVSAQVGDFLPTQKTISTPFGLPIKVDLDGNISFVTGDRDLVFSPGIQIGIDKSTVQYSIPELATEFSLRPPGETTGWMEYKRLRWDYGLGLVATIQQQFRLGLAPYKGAKLTMRRLKTNKDAITSNDIRLPKKLSDTESWALGDEGTYQTYGGIQVYAGLNVGPISVANSTLGWQNQFIVSVQRRADGISLTVTEENLHRRSLKLGVEPANATLMNFKGKQLRAEFNFLYGIPEHHDLYLLALKGEFTKVEDKLSPDRKKISWMGHDLSAYWGIPFLVGNTRSRGSYEVTEDEQDYFLEVMQSKRSGLLVAAALQQKFVYHNSESILLMWTTDMKKSSPSRLRQHFFGPARAVGFTGFDLELEENRHYGTVIGEVGVVVTKDDVENFGTQDISSVTSRLRLRCSELKLKCARESSLRKIMQKYSEAMKSGWDERKKSLGVLLVKEPALLHSLLKETRITKEAYFKFLSDRFQSLEGLTVLSP